MRGFRRQQSSAYFPPDMLDQLEAFGRYTLDPMSSGTDGTKIFSCIPSTDEINADPDRFIHELERVVAHDNVNFATLGAARLVREMLSRRLDELPAALLLIDAGIDFKLARGLPTGLLSQYEMDRVWKRREQGEDI